ncbi:serine hydrolase [Candidatus Sumerlaeota bacterium]|nr:serine hydrolase [Candidatus Sumerlaeota bacterium]
MRRRLILLPLMGALILGMGCRTRMLRRDAIEPIESRMALEQLVESRVINDAVEEACRRAIAAHPEAELDMDHIWAAAIDATDPNLPLFGHWHGNELVYPASAIKTVFMVHVYQRVVDGDLRLSRRVRRLLRDMIRVSSNIATQDIVDLLTGTTNGPRIDQPAAYAAWVSRRNATNRLMRTCGFSRMNANQKTWDELPAEDSVELQFLGADHPMGYANGNRLTAVENAQLLWLIDQDLIVSPRACAHMRRLLHRGGDEDAYGDERIRIGKGVPPEAEVWSKAGSTDRWFHDAATVALPDGRRLVLTVYTDMPWREGLDREAVLATWATEMMNLVR